WPEVLLPCFVPFPCQLSAFSYSASPLTRRPRRTACPCSILSHPMGPGSSFATRKYPVIRTMSQKLVLFGSVPSEASESWAHLTDGSRSKPLRHMGAKRVHPFRSC